LGLEQVSDHKLQFLKYHFHQWVKKKSMRASKESFVLNGSLFFFSKQFFIQLFKHIKADNFSADSDPIV
jgi:hypothetical protein